MIFAKDDISNLLTVETLQMVSLLLDVTMIKTIKGFLAVSDRIMLSILFRFI